MASVHDVLAMLSTTSSATEEGGTIGVRCTLERSSSSPSSPRSDMTLLNDLCLRYDEYIDSFRGRVGALCGYKAVTAMGKGSGSSGALRFVLALSDVTLVALEESEEEEEDGNDRHAPTWIRIESKARSSEEVIRIKPHEEAMAEALAQAISSLAAGQGTMLDGDVGASSLSSRQHQRRVPCAQARHNSHAPLTGTPSIQVPSSSLPRVRPHSQPTLAAYHTSTHGCGHHRGLGQEEAPAATMIEEEQTQTSKGMLRVVISELAELRRTVTRQEETISRLVAVLTENITVTPSHRHGEGGEGLLRQARAPSAGSENHIRVGGGEGIVERGSSSSGGRRPTTRPHRGHVHHHVDPNDDGGDNEEETINDDDVFSAARVRFAPRPATAGGILRPTHELIAEDETEILRPSIRAGRRSSTSSTSSSSGESSQADDRQASPSRPHASITNNRNSSRGDGSNEGGGEEDGKGGGGARLREKEKGEGGNKTTYAASRSNFSPRLTSIPSPPEWTRTNLSAGFQYDEEHLEEGVTLAPSSDRDIIPSVATTISGRVVGRRERRVVENEEEEDEAGSISGGRRATRGRERRRIRSDSRPVVGLGDLGEESMSQIERLAVLSNIKSEEDHSSQLLLRAYRDINGSSSSSYSSSSSSSLSDCEES